MKRKIDLEELSKRTHYSILVLAKKLQQEPCVLITGISLMQAKEAYRVSPKNDTYKHLNAYYVYFKIFLNTIDNTSESQKLQEYFYREALDNDTRLYAFQKFFLLEKEFTKALSFYKRSLEVPPFLPDKISQELALTEIIKIITTTSECLQTYSIVKGSSAKVQFLLLKKWGSLISNEEELFELYTCFDSRLTEAYQAMQRITAQKKTITQLGNFMIKLFGYGHDVHRYVFETMQRRTYNSKDAQEVASFVVSSLIYTQRAYKTWAKITRRESENARTFEEAEQAFKNARSMSPEKTKAECTMILHSPSIVIVRKFHHNATLYSRQQKASLRRWRYLARREYAVIDTKEQAEYALQNSPPNSPEYIRALKKFAKLVGPSKESLIRILNETEDFQVANLAARQILKL